ncbi:MAG: ABC-2 family transporter protein [Candidatus Latescibacterota bacterium]
MALRKYLTVFRVNWLNSLQYRAPTVIYVVGYTLYVAVLLSLWVAIYRDDGRVGGYALNELVTYYLLQFVSNTIVVSYVSWEITDHIREGFYSHFLVKPVDYFAYWFTINASGKLLEAAVIGLVVGCVWSIAGPLVRLPSQPQTWLAFAAAVALAAVLAFELEFCIGLIAFWLVQVRVFKYILTYAVLFLAGTVLPLDVFPGALSRVASVLPFQYLVFVPIQVFLEKRPAPLADLGLATAWIAVFYGVARWVLVRGTARYEAVGN